MPHCPQSSWSSRCSAGALVLSLVGGALAAIALGQDGGFDLKNYHHYNAWALLGGRLSHDFVVAQQQTWFNPLLDLHYYLSLLLLGPKLGSALVGAIQGLAFWLLFEIAGCLLPTRAAGWSPPERLSMAVAVVAVGICGPITWVNVGASRGDLTVSIFVLASLLLLLNLPDFASHKEATGGGARIVLLASGALMGLACGLKLTAASFAVGGVVALLLSSSGSVAERVRRSAAWAGSAVIAIAVSAGPWMYVLWTHYGSPVFPFANHIIASPYAPRESFSEQRFRPDGLADALSYPLQFASGGEVAWEFAFRDLRLGLLYVLLVFLAGRLAWSRARAQSLFKGSPGLFMLLTFAVVSYLVWQLTFCVYRYLAPLELLAPALIVAVLVSLLPRPAHALCASAATLALIAGMVQMPAVERLDWADDIFGVQLPEPEISPASVVVLAGDDATSYLTTYFPPAVRFLRIAGNFSAADEDTQMHRDMAQLLGSASGPLYFLKGPYEIDHEALQVFGLILEGGSCRPVFSRVDRDLALCSLQRE